MNDEYLKTPFETSEDDGLSRAIDRLADGECTPAEEADLLASFDELPGAWKTCALALLEARDVRRALSAIDRGGNGPLVVASAATLASNDFGSDKSSSRWKSAPWFAAALASLLAFAVGFAVSPGFSSDPPQVAGARDSVAANGTNDEPDATEPVAAAPDAGEGFEAGSDEPGIVNVVYRPEGAAEERSAPLPVYESDETWVRVLDEAVRQSEADLAGRRAHLLSQGADLERQIVLHPVVAEGKEMLIPVETFQIVPASLSSYH